HRDLSDDLSSTGVDPIEVEPGSQPPAVLVPPVDPHVVIARRSILLLEEGADHATVQIKETNPQGATLRCDEGEGGLGIERIRGGPSGELPGSRVDQHVHLRAEDLARGEAPLEGDRDRSVSAEIAEEKAQIRLPAAGPNP